MTEIVVYYATNRLPYRVRPSDQPEYVSGIAFAAEPGPFDGKALRFGRAKIEVPRGGEGVLREVYVADERLMPRSERGSQKLGSKEIYEELRHAVVGPETKGLASGSKPGIFEKSINDVLFVLHGYANSFEGGLIGAAEIAERVGRRNVFVFCWPSTDLVLGVNYGKARANARTSGEAIGRAFAILMRFLADLQKKGERCERKIDVIAHSMGNYALRSAVQAMVSGLGDGAAASLIDDLVLVAADDDNDTLEVTDGIAPLVPFVRRTTVYYSPQDYVLHHSDKVKFNPDRLGQTGPQSMGNTPDNVVAIDVTDLIEDDPADSFLGHWYHRQTPLVIGDIAATLTSRDPDPGTVETPDTRRAPLPAGPRRYKLLKI